MTQIDEGKIQAHLGEVVRSTVEETLNARLDACEPKRNAVSELSQKIYAQIETWGHRPIEGNHPYVFVDGLWPKLSWGGEVRNVSLLLAIAVTEGGFREVLTVAVGLNEDQVSWTAT